MKSDIIKTRKQLRDWIQYEQKQYGIRKKDLKYFFHIGETNVLVYHQILLRKAEYYSNTKHFICGLWFRYLLSGIQNRYALHIPLNSCGRGLRIMHLGPVLVNGNAVIGDNCTLHMNTAVVAGGTNDDCPVLEDGVILGIGAVVLGKVYIAKNVAVGANAVVNKSILEENIAIAGVPAKKISNNGSCQWGKAI